MTEFYSNVTAFNRHRRLAVGRELKAKQEKGEANQASPQDKKKRKK
jgi:hypothetical protein